MITETTRDKALIAAANGKPAFVISQTGEVPEIINLTKMLHNALTEENNIFIADTEPEVQPEPEKEPEPETPPLKEKPRVLPAKRTRGGQGGRKSKLDDGKIAALFNAGWSYEKIAEEMGVIPNTIHTHLVKLREEGKL